MELFGILILLLAAVTFILIISVIIRVACWICVYHIFKFTGISIGIRRPLIYRLPTVYTESVLSRYVPFYQNLDADAQRLFCHRLLKFMNKKQFQGREGLEVTDEMRIVISAAAIKLTLGHTRYLLPHFDTIIIYPHNYYSKHTGLLHKGETNHKGIVVFSWDNVIEGFADEGDRLNLGYHEFAHALYIQMQTNDLKTDPRLFICGNELKDLFHARGEIYEEAISSGIIREYGFTNFMEFFAVVTETFFEQPEALRHRCPTLHRKMLTLYGHKSVTNFRKN